MIEDEDEELTNELVEEFLLKVDHLVAEFSDHGLAYYTIAGSLQAYITHIYTLSEDPDFEGLEHLLTTALETIQNRPKWEI